MEPVNSSLDILRQETSNQMKALVVEKEPILLKAFETEIDDNWAIFSLIRKSENFEVKLKLTELLVQEEIDEGDFFGAVFALATVNSAEMDLGDKFDEDFVTQLFNKSVEKDEKLQAMGIALIMQNLPERITSETLSLDWAEKLGEVKESILEGEKLSDKLKVVLENYREFGKIFALALREKNEIMAPYKNVAGDLIDSAIVEVLEKMGFEIDNNNIRELKQINKVVKG